MRASHAMGWIACFLVLFLVNTAFAEPSPMEELGRFLYTDKGLSRNGNQSCDSCHRGSTGYADPFNMRDPFHSMTSLGSDGVSVGVRNAPTFAYAGFVPALHYDAGRRAYVGGLAWDGRATGEMLDDPLAEQALLHILNKYEMGAPDKEAAVRAVRRAEYAGLFIDVFGPGSLDSVEAAYTNIGKAIAAYGRSGDVNGFSSKFDQFWRKCKDNGVDVSRIGIDADLANPVFEPAIMELSKDNLTQLELWGLALFNNPNKGNCAACHATTSHDGVTPPLFSDFTYENLGMPASVLDSGDPDPGLGGVVARPAQNGKFRVPTLRNVYRTAPYGHNGYFATLYEVVDYFNSRDLPERNWPRPEILDNLVVGQIGNAGLTTMEIVAIVAFMGTLTDQ